MAAARRTIGQLANEAGVGVETIRFYERRGLVRRPAAPEHGYRHYGDDVLAMVRYIRLAQQLGLSLRDIERLRDQLDDRTKFCGAVRAAVDRKLDELGAELARLTRLKDELQGFVDRCRARPAGLSCPIFEDLTRADTGLATPRPARGRAR